MGKPPVGSKHKMAGHRSPQIMFWHDGEGGKIPLSLRNMGGGGHGTLLNHVLRWEWGGEAQNTLNCIEVQDGGYHLAVRCDGGVGVVKNPLCRIETRDGGAVQGTEAPHLVFRHNGGLGVVENPLCRIETRDGGLWCVDSPLSHTSTWWRGRDGRESPLSHRNRRWRGGAGHRSPLSCVSTQWGVGGGRISPLSHQNMRWGVVMHRCPPSHTSMWWRGRDGRELGWSIEMEGDISPHRVEKMESTRGGCPPCRIQMAGNRRDCRCKIYVLYSKNVPFGLPLHPSPPLLLLFSPLARCVIVDAW